MRDNIGERISELLYKQGPVEAPNILGKSGVFALDARVW